MSAAPRWLWTPAAAGRRLAARNRGRPGRHRQLLRALDRWPAGLHWRSR